MKRVLLKLSGEALAGEKKTGFDEATCIGVAKQVKQLVDEGVQVAIVTGGGNFWRGRTSETIDRTKADHRASAAAAEGKEAGLSLHLPQHRADTAVLRQGHRAP